MAQWIKVHSFINMTRLPLLCEKSGGLVIVELGLMAVWQAIRQTKML